MENVVVCVNGKEDKILSIQFKVFLEAVFKKHNEVYLAKFK
jgi:hypothetical protein